jgi:stage V sporulation protein AD
VSIVSTACIVGPKEGQGPLKHYYDEIIDDEMWGEKSWERAESKLMRETLAKVINKAGKAPMDIDYIVAGDLLNQCMASNFGMRESGIPFLGVYGACSTMAQSLIVGTMLIDGGYADNILCLTSSHFCSADKAVQVSFGTWRSKNSDSTVGR